MSENQTAKVVGLDVGSECIKAVVMNEDRAVLGRSVTPARGHFQACIEEALRGAIDESGVDREDLSGCCATGFGASCAPKTAMVLPETTCHALAAYAHSHSAMTLIDIGARDPRVIAVDEKGGRIENRSVRRCAVGAASFLNYTARHLDVHPTRLQELAIAADGHASVTSYCSVFASTEVLERLREGRSCEEIAQGAIRSVAERIAEIGGFDAPLWVTGGIAEYFPGVVKVLSELVFLPVEVVPNPLYAGAYGAALKALEGATS